MYTKVQDLVVKAEEDLRERLNEAIGWRDNLLEQSERVNARAVSAVAKGGWSEDAEDLYQQWDRIRAKLQRSDYLVGVLESAHIDIVVALEFVDRQLKTDPDYLECFYDVDTVRCRCGSKIIPAYITAEDEDLPDGRICERTRKVI